MTSNIINEITKIIWTKSYEIGEQRKVFGPYKQLAVYWRYYCRRPNCRGHAFVATGSFLTARSLKAGVVDLYVGNVVRHLSYEQQLTTCEAGTSWNPFKDLDKLTFKVTEDSCFYTVSNSDRTGLQFESKSLMVKVAFFDKNDVNWKQYLL